MKPTLTVEGKEFEVCSIHYRNNKVNSVSVMDEYGVMKTYHDVSENTQYYTEKPLQLDFETCLKWIGQYDGIHQELTHLIEARQSELNVLAHEIARTTLPFLPNEKQNDYFEIERESVILRDVIEMIEGCMQDDVDLNGGEEIDPE